MILCISVLSVVISPFSFLILLIWFFSLWFLMSLANFFNFIYPLKEPAFCFVDLCYGHFCFFCIYFCSNFGYLFSSTNPGVLHFFLYSCFRCRVRLFIWLFSCFLRYACIAMNFPLSTGFTVSHRFWVVVFSFSFISMHILISF